MNLLKETIEVLKENGKTPKDIVWCGSSDGWFTWDEFTEVADIEYDESYGGNEIAGNLKIVGKDWWLERGEYDGSEWWEYKTQIKKPSVHKLPKSVEKIDYVNEITFKEVK